LARSRIDINRENNINLGVIGPPANRPAIVSACWRK
jgi:hypothetical protein